MFFEVPHRRLYFWWLYPFPQPSIPLGVFEIPKAEFKNRYADADSIQTGLLDGTVANRQIALNDRIHAVLNTFHYQRMTNGYLQNIPN